MNRSAICNLRHNELLYVVIRVAGARLGRRPPRWVTGGSIAGGLVSTPPQWPRPISLAIGAPPPGVACGQSWPRPRTAQVGKETAPPVEQRNLTRDRTFFAGLPERNRHRLPPRNFISTFESGCGERRTLRWMGYGFEPSVAGTKEPVFVCRGRIAGTDRGQPKRLFLMRYRWFESISLLQRVTRSFGS